MAKGILVDNPNLEAITIKDFSPGLYSGAYNTFISSPNAPLGSCFDCGACYYRPGIGLCPLPSATNRLSKTFNVGTGSGFLTCCDMVVAPGAASIAGQAAGDLVFTNWMKYGSSLANPYNYDIDQWQDSVSTSFNVFAGSSNGAFQAPIWPNMTSGFFIQGGQNTWALITINPVGNSQTFWLVVPGTTGAGSDTAQVASQWNTKTAYVTSRMLFMGQQGTFISPGGGLAGVDLFTTGDIQADTNVISQAYYAPETLGSVGAWGSVSTGEFFVVGINGGGVVISGDIQNPSSAIYLPAIVGTGSAVGQAIASPIGLIYCTDFEGVQVWNGGNTSQKISTQLVDQQPNVPTFLRANPMSGILGRVTTPTTGTSSMGRWGNWVIFPNNLLFDCITNAWWNLSDIFVAPFPDAQVFSKTTGASQQYFWGVDQPSAISSGGGSLTANYWRFDRGTPSYHWRWVSTPIPFPGGITNLQEVEICASNFSSTSCTVTVQASPTNESSGGPVLSQNQTQTVTFTVPPGVYGWRGAQRLGFTDYNVSIIVNAKNSNTSNPAPTLHEITLGVDRRPSNVN